jgi:AGZA family xanthine/uracil permease-like MFS transporter
MLEKLFKLAEHKTTVKKEIGGGLITFMTMAYIIFVQPGVLSIAGMDFNSVMVATCLSAAIGTFIMAFLANYPVAQASAMGENFLFLTVASLSVGGTVLGWRGALTAVLFSGVMFIILTMLKFRQAIIRSLPDSLKHAIAVGIGIFISFIGLRWAGIIEKPKAGVLAVADMGRAPVLLALFGLVIITILLSRKVRGAILWGMLIATGAGLIFGIIKYQGIISMPPSISPTLMKFDFSLFLTVDFLVVAVIFLFMDLFDAMGTLVAVANQAGLLNKKNENRLGRALMGDAIGTVGGALFGTSTVSSFIESSAGIAYGARTGLASFVTGILFLLAIFFSPLVKMIGGGCAVAGGEILYPITAPVMIIVGCLMTKSIKEIDWDTFDEALPAFLMIIGMPLTYSIADGMAFGFISYPLLKLFSGKGKQVPVLIYILGLMFLVYMISRQILLGG